VPEKTPGPPVALVIKNIFVFISFSSIILRILRAKVLTVDYNFPKPGQHWRQAVRADDGIREPCNGTPAPPIVVRFL
jgi:hypothetical protein